MVMPYVNTTELIRKASQARYISVCDCTQGFYSIELKPSSRYLTCFGIGDSRLFVLNRLPMGHCTSAQCFAKVLSQVLNDVTEGTCQYIDDIGVITVEDDFDLHLKQVDQVLSKLKAAGLAVKFSKCLFGQRQAVFLGHLVGGGEHTPATLGTEAVTR